MPKIFPAYRLNYTEDILHIKDKNPSKLLPEKENLSYTLCEEDDSVQILDIFELTRKRKQVQEQESHTFLHEEIAEEAVLAEPSPMAQEVLEAAQAEAEQIKEWAFQTAMVDKDRLLQQAREEADVLLQSAKKEGFEKGLDESVATVKERLNDLEHIVARLEGDLAGFEVELQEQLRWMSLEIASRVLSQKVSENDAILSDMVEQTVQGVRNMPWIRIEVAQDMTKLIKKLQNVYDGQEHIEVSPIPAEGGVIQIETPSGRLDASVKTQLENLRTYFQKNSE